MKRALVVLVCLLVAGTFGAGGYVIYEQQERIDELSLAVRTLEESSQGGASVDQVDTLRQETADAFAAAFGRIEGLESRVGNDLLSTALPGEGLEERVGDLEQDLTDVGRQVDEAARRVGQACTALMLAGAVPAC